MLEQRHFDIVLNLFQAEATSEGSQEYFENVVSMLKARKEMSSSSGGVSVGIYYVEVGLSGSQESEFLRNLTQYKSQVCSIDPTGQHVIDCLRSRFGNFVEAIV